MDHPHAYGDKCFIVSATLSSQGSSPRVWGQVAGFGLKGWLLRIIPTRMGTRVLIRYHAPLVQDHPHAYGDKFREMSEADLRQGSSPRVWGQGNILCIFPRGDRIIPTRMGTSHTYNRITITAEDHPHAYGDKAIFTISYNTTEGSSPRVWGQVRIGIQI